MDRLGQSKIEEQHKVLSNTEFINNVFNSLPHIAAVINDKRQIIFSNESLLNKLGIESIQNVLGSRPGEILNCENVKFGKDGCGTSDKCQYCGAMNAITSSQTKNMKVESECTITSNRNGEILNYEFGIVVNPFKHKEDNFYILSLFDVSDSKRRAFLEKIFFHDIMNKVGSLNGFLQLIKILEEPEKLNEYIDTLDDISQQIIQEIVSQKQLLDAEAGSLTLNTELIDSLSTLESLVRQISKHEVNKEVNVRVSDTANPIQFLSDSSLINRVLFNMLKNAVEASKEGEVVTIHCEKINSGVLFSVHNPKFIEEHIQAQIFKKSFSTKDYNRGLGTYSMKLLTEKYLKGKIYFRSTKAEGSIFFLELKTEH